ncbi:MAG: sulfate reduction electron transfer complex DsrMKJOP subunit DsrM [Chitinispirillia bacterium]
MKNHFILSLIAILILCLISYVGAGITGLQGFFGIFIPYVAIAVFIGGFIWKVLNWSKSPVPFRITTTCGQQKSLPWIKAGNLDNPFSKRDVFFRMVLEVMFFRSLFRNSRMSLQKNESGLKVVYDWEIFLWAASLLFHYSFLIVCLRHLRFFMGPVPGLITFIETLDGFFRIELFKSFFSVGLPGIMLSGLFLFLAGLFLLARRIFSAKINYISLAADYFPLLLILGIAYTGLQMRYFTKVDILGVKELAMGLVTLRPVIPDGIGVIFYMHIFLVSTLLIYFPFSKLMHFGGIFLSPTRNLTADTRANRHINPWNYPVKTHTYEEYEDEFREKMVGAGLPVEKKE